MLRWWELVPLLSFIFLQGRCARCQNTISAQYPIVELSVGLLWVLLARPWYAGDFSESTVAAVLVMCVLAGLLVVLLVIDVRTLLLPDVYVGMLALLVGGCLVAVQLGWLRLGLVASIERSALGALIGAGFLWLLWLVTRGRGIGLGDVKLLVPLGALFGPRGTIVLLWLAFVLGGLVGIWLLVSGRARLRTPIPFGPFLCGVALLLLVWPALPDLAWRFFWEVPIR